MAWSTMASCGGSEPWTVARTNDGCRTRTVKGSSGWSGSLSCKGGVLLYTIGVGGGFAALRSPKKGGVEEGSCSGVIGVGAVLVGDRSLMA